MPTRHVLTPVEGTDSPLGREAEPASVPPGPRPDAPIRNVALVVQDGVEAFGLGTMCEVWNEPYHPEEDNPLFDFAVTTPRPGTVRGSAGFDLVVEHGLERTVEADLVVVVPYRDYRAPDPAAVEAVAAAHARGALVLAHCTAAWLLGAAGLLDGRRYTTHWRHGDVLQRDFPAGRLERDVLYVQDGTLLTGAGTAAGMDASLHLLRQHFGSKIAADAARRMVVPPHREGGQAQFVARPVAECESELLAPLLDWISEHLDGDLSVEELASRVAMSPRTFARRFKDETGVTPYQWVIRRRVAAAEELLERSDASVDRIAAQVGFGSSAALRQHFARERGVSPQTYRRSFGVAG